MSLKSLWEDFSKSDRILFFSLFGLVAIGLIGSVILSVLGTQNAFGWNVVSELEQIPTVLDTYTNNGLRFNINSYAYVVKEYFWAGGMPVLTVQKTLTLFCFGFGLVAILTALTTLQQNYFLVGSALFSLIFVSFQIQLSVGFSNAGFWLLFLIFIGTAFYINAFAQHIQVWKRAALFFVESLIFVGLVVFLGKENTHYVDLIVAFGMISFVVLSCVFIILVSHQVVYLLLNIVTRNAQQGQNLVQKYLLIALIYVVNLFLLYFKTSKTFGSWDGLFINPTMLLALSVVVGIFYFKQWCEATQVLRFSSAGAWLYGGLALITVTTIVYAYTSGNDALTEFFDDFVMYAHLSLGLCCIVHILINFIQPLQRGLQVHKVVFKPLLSKFVLARFFGIAGIVVLFLLKNNFSLWQVTAGYLNGLGDYYRVINETEKAEKAYNDGLKLDPLNHHGNYANAFLATLRDDNVTASYFYKQAGQRVASEQSFVANSKFHVDNNRFFQAVFTLRDGLKKFPKSPYLMTNLAMLYDRSQIQDSTFFYLNGAKNNGSEPSFTSNLLGFWAKFGKTEELQKMTDDLNENASTTALANAIAIKSRQLLPTEKQKKIQFDSVLNVSQFAVLFNRNVNKSPADEADFETWQNQPQNSEFYNDLVYARACRAYYASNKIRGLGLLSLLTKDEGTLPLLSKRTIGIWLLQEGVYGRGLDFMRQSGDSASVALIEKQGIESDFNGVLQKQATDLLKSAKTQLEYDKALAKAPLNPWLVNKVARFYSEKLRNDKTAYDFVSDALFINEDHPELLKTHAILALRQGLNDYAETSLNKLNSIDYQQFKPEFDREKALRNVEFK